MSFLRLHRRISGWLALLAVLLGALAPTVSQAMVASGDRAQWIEVCSVSGMTWVRADLADAATDVDGGSPASEISPHCPWCMLHGGVAGLPPAADQALPLARQTDLPAAFYQAAHTSTVWNTARSRAPPLAS